MTDRLPSTPAPTDDTSKPIGATEDSPSASARVDVWVGERGDYNDSDLICETDDFIVYLRKNHEVHWVTTTKHDEWLKQRKIVPSDCQSQISYMESVPVSHWDRDLIRTFRCQLGEAMALTLRGRTKKSRQVLATAKRFLLARNQEYARRLYVICSTITAAVFMLASWSVYGLAKYNHLDWNIEIIAHVGIGSSLGSLLSTLTRMKRTAIDPYAGSYSHSVEAVARLLIGMIFAIAAVCAVNGGFLLPQIIKDGHGLFLLCLVSGAGERFGGTVIERFDAMFSKPMDGSPPPVKAKTPKPAIPAPSGRRNNP